MKRFLVPLLVFIMLMLPGMVLAFHSVGLSSSGTLNVREASSGGGGGGSLPHTTATSTTTTTTTPIITTNTTTTTPAATTTTPTTPIKTTTNTRTTRTVTTPVTSSTTTKTGQVAEVTSTPTTMEKPPGDGMNNALFIIPVTIGMLGLAAFVFWKLRRDKMEGLLDDIKWWAEDRYYDLKDLISKNKGE